DLGDLHARYGGVDGLEWAANLGGSVWLRIPGVDVARPADEKEHDAVDVLVWLLCAGLLTPHQTHPARQRQPEQRQRAGVQEIPSTPTVAKGNAPLGIDAQHGSVSPRNATSEARSGWNIQINPQADRGQRKSNSS